ncbi:MAG: RNA polymerase sigma factor [Syntrophorhabdus sp. PtaU1.Bin153]|nr:MAG: RNA polymerase sigma factor [Syntrophorhabdus sp. PtaU1.Bin153]
MRSEMRERAERGIIDLSFIENLRKGHEKEWRHILGICDRMAGRYIHDPLKRESLISDVYTQIVEEISSTYDPQYRNTNVEANLIGWLQRKVWDAYRHTWRQRMFENSPDDLPSHDADPDTTLLGDDVTKALLGFCREKKEPARVRQIILLHFLYGHTTKEVARHMGEKFAAVNTLIHRTKKEFAAYLRRKGIDEHHFA